MFSLSIPRWVAPTVSLVLVVLLLAFAALTFSYIQLANDQVAGTLSPAAVVPTFTSTPAPSASATFVDATPSSSVTSGVVIVPTPQVVAFALPTATATPWPTQSPPPAPTIPPLATPYVPLGWQPYTILQGGAAFWYPPGWIKQNEELDSVRLAMGPQVMQVTFFPEYEWADDGPTVTTVALKRILTDQQTDAQLVFDRDGVYDAIHTPSFVTAIWTDQGQQYSSLMSYATDGVQVLVILYVGPGPTISDATIAMMGDMVRSAFFDMAGMGQIMLPTPAPFIPTATPTAAPLPAGPYANTAANLRRGPGTDYDLAGSAAAGQQLPIVAQTQTGDWYQLADGSWIAAFLVNNAPAGLPVAQVIPPPPAVEAAPAPVTGGYSGPTVESMRSVFENYGFQFGTPEWEDGIQELYGMSADGMVYVHIVGSPDRLTLIGIMVVRGSTEGAEQWVEMISIVAELVVPGFEELFGWMDDQLNSRSGDEFKVDTEFQGVNIRFSSNSDSVYVGFLIP